VACSQILFSLSPGFGTAITMSSTSPPHADVFRTALTVGIANSAFSLVSGFGMFAILGDIALQAGQTMQETADAAGPGLAFVVIAEGMKLFGPLANVMSVLFFLMLVSLGLDSSFAWLETVVTIVQDVAREHGYETNKVRLTGILSVMLFFIGLLFTTRAGFVLFDIVDHFLAVILLLIICFFECVALMTTYPFERILKGIKKATRTDDKPEGNQVCVPMFWKCTMYGTAPLAVLVLFTSKFVADLANPYEGYPSHLLIIFGWIPVVSLTLVIIGFIVKDAVKPSGKTTSEESSDDDSNEDSEATSS